MKITSNYPQWLRIKGEPASGKENVACKAGRAWAAYLPLCINVTNCSKLDVLTVLHRTGNNDTGPFQTLHVVGLMTLELSPGRLG